VYLQLYYRVYSKYLIIQYTKVKHKLYYIYSQWSQACTMGYPDLDPCSIFEYALLLECRLLGHANESSTGCQYYSTNCRAISMDAKKGCGKWRLQSSKLRGAHGQLSSTAQWDLGLPPTILTVDGEDHTFT
jgi:hypothetical protein